LARLARIGPEDHRTWAGSVKEMKAPGCWRNTSDALIVPPRT
jgi:hypothetical protein